MDRGDSDPTGQRVPAARPVRATSLKAMVSRTTRPADSDEEAAGRELGDYRLIRRLGAGGMGTVWEAEQVSLGRRVALKLLAPQLSLSEDTVARFHREAVAGGRLNHSGIVVVHEVGEVDGAHFITQELVPGGFTLDDFLRGVAERDELPPGYYRAVAELFAKVADALQAAHEAGVIHRDVKPGNILIDEDDEPKVADFGLAQVNDDLVRSRTLELAGTPFYMSPEQAMSKAMGLDARTDVFSLGATLGACGRRCRSTSPSSVPRRWRSAGRTATRAWRTSPPTCGATSPANPSTRARPAP
ncbi:MAG: serine/threonine-protein kinase [Planctomycetota bacterium]|jgi:serine/threonine protein kinase